MKTRNVTETDSSTTLTTIAASISILEADIAKRTSQRAEAAAALETHREAAATASQRCEDLLLACADGDAAAQAAQKEADADCLRAGHELMKCKKMIERLDGELTRLRRDVKAAHEAKARAENDADAAEAEQYAADVDRHAAALVAAEQGRRAVRARQAARLRAAGLHAEADRLVHVGATAIKQRLSWILQPLERRVVGRMVTRPLSHSMQELEIGAIERRVQRREPLTESDAPAADDVQPIELLPDPVAELEAQIAAKNATTTTH